MLIFRALLKTAVSSILMILTYSCINIISIIINYARYATFAIENPSISCRCCIEKCRIIFTGNLFQGSVYQLGKGGKKKKRKGEKKKGEKEKKEKSRKAEKEKKKKKKNRGKKKRGKEEKSKKGNMFGGA